MRSFVAQVAAGETVISGTASSAAARDDGCEQAASTMAKNPAARFEDVAGNRRMSTPCLIWDRREWDRAQVYDDCDDIVISDRALDVSCLALVQAKHVAGFLLS
jgi:hypothetical protein